MDLAHKHPVITDNGNGIIAAQGHRYELVERSGRGHGLVFPVNVVPCLVKPGHAGPQGPLGLGDRKQADVALFPVDNPCGVAVASGDGVQRCPRPLVAHQGSLGRHHHLAGRQDRFQAHVLREVPDVFVLRSEHNVLRRPNLGHAAIVQDGDAVAQLQRLIEVVGDKDDGLLQFFLQSQQLILHLAAYQGVEAAERLVHEQNFGVYRQGPGQAHPLLHPAGQLARIGIFPTGEADEVQHFAGAGVTVFLADALHLQAPGRVVQHVAVGHQPVVLEDHCYLLTA